MTVKQSKNGTWFTQFRCKNKFGEEVHKCKRGFASPEEAQTWEDDFIASAGCTMAMTFEEFYEVYEADVRPRLREHTWRNKSYQCFDSRDVFTDPKTPKSTRAIKLSRFLVEEVADYFGRHPEIRPNDRMFLVTKYQISRAMKNGCQKSGVKRIRVHDLRHSHVSLLIDKGFTSLAIAERMGHEATDITFRYAHLFPTVQEDMANVLDDEKGGF